MRRNVLELSNQEAHDLFDALECAIGLLRTKGMSDPDTEERRIRWKRLVDRLVIDSPVFNTGMA
jgi:hypothetical protein